MGWFVTRGQGFKDGSEDVRGFVAGCLDGKVRPAKSLLLRSAMAEARTVSDPAGNRKLSRKGEGGRRQLARDDAAAAAILAVAEGIRATTGPSAGRGLHGSHPHHGPRHEPPPSPDA